MATNQKEDAKSVSEYATKWEAESKLPQPLISNRELSEMARKALKKQVRNRIEELTVNQSTLTQMLGELQAMRETLQTHLEKLGANAELERGVLEKLDRKLV